MRTSNQFRVALALLGPSAVFLVIPSVPRAIKAMAPEKAVIFEGECKIARGLLRATEDREGMSAGLNCGTLPDVVRTSDTLVIATCLNRPTPIKCRVFRDGSVECAQCPPWRLLSPVRPEPPCK